MNAKRYKIKVYGSLLEYSHEMGTTIEEICIPSKKLFVNSRAVFAEDDCERRLKEVVGIHDITLDKKIVEKLCSFVKHKEEIKQIQKLLFKGDDE